MPKHRPPGIGPSVPPKKASINKVDSATRQDPARAFALSIPNIAKARRFSAMKAAARVVGVRRVGIGVARIT